MFVCLCQLETWTIRQLRAELGSCATEEEETGRQEKWNNKLVERMLHIEGLRDFENYANIVGMFKLRMNITHINGIRFFHTDLLW